MKKIYFIALTLMFSGAYAQIEQNVNKTGGTESNPINEIDSIRFNGAQTEMEIILNDGNIESHIIEEIDNVTFSGEIEGEVASFDCAGATINGTLVDGEAASGVSAEIDYTGGNGGPHNGQTVASTGVTGLTAELTAGNFASGAGTLTYEITGTPDSDGTASFAIEIGGETCTLEITVEEADPYPTGTVHCDPNNPTEIVDVTSTTGNTWMDRNLGAEQAATSSTDADSYGDLYQWGRFSDGHQCRTSSTTTDLSSSDQPGHDEFITTSIGSTPNDWRDPQNDNLWQGVSGVNNPCPTGYRLPTLAELDNERQSWSSNDEVGAFDSPLKLPLAGRRFYAGAINQVDSFGQYWTSTIDGSESQRLQIGNSDATTGSLFRGNGHSVRCIKD